MKLIHTRLHNGIWHANLTGSPTRPALELRIGDQRLHDFNVTELAGIPDAWQLTATLPAALLSEEEGLLSVVDVERGDVIGMLQITAGPTLAGDQSAEIARLRQELEVVKEVVRKHLRSAD